MTRRETGYVSKKFIKNQFCAGKISAIGIRTNTFFTQPFITPFLIERGICGRMDLPEGVSFWLRN